VTLSRVDRGEFSSTEPGSDTIQAPKSHMLPEIDPARKRGLFLEERVAKS
jgi:hypothetical protein